MFYKMKSKKAIIGSGIVMIFAFIFIFIILAISLFFASAYQPFKKTDKETAKIQSSMAYHSLKNYLDSEVTTSNPAGKIPIYQLIDLWAFDSSYKSELDIQTKSLLDPTFRNCYEIKIPYFNGKPYFIPNVNEDGFLSIGTPNNADYSEIIIPSKLNGDKVILARLSLDNKCLGVEK